MSDQPLTLYFDLKSERRPTIGTIGRAMIEFEKMADEAIFLLEPGIEFSIVYETSATGSLRIIASLKGLVSRERLRDLALIVATTLVVNGVSYFQGMAMDEVIEAISGEKSTLSDEDIARIAEAVRSVERSETVRAPKREFYRAVESDEAITGVGVIPNETTVRPEIVVPKDVFSVMASANRMTISSDVLEPRTKYDRKDVVLVQPPLIDSNRQWKVFVDGHEIGAKMLDDNFKQKVLSGSTQLRLAGGVILDITLETTQIKESGLWKNKSFAITEVHGWQQNPEQAELMLSHRADDDDQASQDDDEDGPR